MNSLYENMISFYMKTSIRLKSYKSYNSKIEDVFSVCKKCFFLLNGRNTKNRFLQHFHFCSNLFHVILSIILHFTLVISIFTNKLLMHIIYINIISKICF